MAEQRFPRLQKPPESCEMLPKEEVAIERHQRDLEQWAVCELKSSTNWQKAYFRNAAFVKQCGRADRATKAILFLSSSSLNVALIIYL
jgi:hypothetical protein